MAPRAEAHVRFFRFPLTSSPSRHGPETETPTRARDAGWRRGQRGDECRPPAAAPRRVRSSTGETAPPGPTESGREGETEVYRVGFCKENQKVCASGDEGGPGPPAKSPQQREAEASRLMAKRPSDRRSPGRNPGPQGAFEVSMINVSCNSH